MNLQVKRSVTLLATSAMLAVVGGWGAAQAEPVEISFYYPVAIGGPVTKIVDDLITRFEGQHPDIKVKPIYSGTYPETLSKSLTAFKSGQAPEVAVMLSTDMFTLIDEDAIVPYEDLAKTDDDKAWLAASRRFSWSTARAKTKHGGACRSSEAPPFSSGTRMPSRKLVLIQKKARRIGKTLSTSQQS
ncbi:hypothetical protein Q644_18515 [Brucella intermedia 229E]|uniref:Extracellular solute-binding protein n=1 Tax=Brucella intermedia 229E TaxID=1337887 RepID=U4VGS1_9HYPH|nr:hypothetical protein Q644_18515 [Brucella intermedia 229E]